MGEDRFNRAQMEYIANSPPIEVGQVWVSYADGVVYRRIRILAPHPDVDKTDGKRRWIYDCLPGGRLRTTTGELGICPEFNLRYVFRMEQNDAH